MPTDPSILLAVKPPDPLPTPDEVAERQLKLVAARAQTQQLIDAARQRAQAQQDDRDLQDVLSSNLGPDGLPDLEKAIPAAYARNPRVGQKLVSSATAARKAQAETDDLEDKHKTALIDSAGQLLQGATEDNWPIRYGVLSRTNPEVARMFGPQWDASTPEKVSAFADAAMKRKDYSDLQQKVREDYLAGKDDQGIARQINALGDQLTPDRAVDIARTARDKYNVNTQVASTVAELSSLKNPDGTPNLGPLKDWARKAELGQKEVETFAGQEKDRAERAVNQGADNTRQAAALEETARHNRVEENLAQQRINKPTASGNSADQSDVQETIQGMIDGTVPPDLPSRGSRVYTAMTAEAHRQGFDLTKANEDWSATKRYLTTLNGSQQVRLRQAVNFTAESLPLVRGLVKQWDSAGLPILSKANLDLAASGAFGPTKQSLAVRLKGQIADLTSELGTVYKGGNSSTDESLKLAAQNLQGSWSKTAALDALDQIETNLHIRQNSIRNTGPIGGTEQNPYAPATGTGQPKNGDQKPITLPGYPAGAMQEFRDGKWIRIK